MFFGANTDSNVEDRARDFQRAVSHVDGMIIDRDLTEVKVANHLLYRVDYSGVGLFRARLETEVRCHVVSVNVTTNDKELLERLAGIRDSLSFTTIRDAASLPPPCAKDYAVGDNVLHKVDPVSMGPKFVPIPVRIIVGADGSVEHVHVIHATNDQRRSIEDALYRWKLKPYEVDGRPSPVETGLVFQFTTGTEESRCATAPRLWRQDHGARIMAPRYAKRCCVRRHRHRPVFGHPSICKAACLCRPTAWSRRRGR